MKAGVGVGVWPTGVEFLGYCWIDYNTMASVRRNEVFCLTFLTFLGLAALQDLAFAHFSHPWPTSSIAAAQRQRGNFRPPLPQLYVFPPSPPFLRGFLPPLLPLNPSKQNVVVTPTHPHPHPCRNTTYIDANGGGPASFHSSALPPSYGPTPFPHCEAVNRLCAKPTPPSFADRRVQRDER